MRTAGTTRWIWAAVGAALVGACATTPPQEKTAYDQAMDEVQRLQADPLANQAAAKPLSEAQIDLANADAAAMHHMVDDAIHWSYLATREAQIGEAMTATMRAHMQIAQANEERTQIVQEAQRRRAEIAERQAQEAEQRAQQAEQELAQLKQQQQNEETQQQIAQAQDRAQAAAEQAAQAQQQAAQAQQHAQQEIAEAQNQAQQQIAQAQQQAEQARRQEEEARRQLEAMQARETDRGRVLVLGNDVLFASGRDQLEPGALSTLHQVAQFLHDHPQEKLRIEGFTDSRGSDALNDSLSQRRAEAVAKALEADGVAPDRVQAIGRGSSLPLASNATAAGRQQNRRVEIVFSNSEGQFKEHLAEAPQTPSQ